MTRAPALTSVDLGDVFKDRERLQRNFLPGDDYAVLRLDGRAFHTYCRGLDFPFDIAFMADMDATAKAVADGIAGVRATYVQSDEISVVLTPWNPDRDSGDHVELMFGGNVQKLVTIAASIASVTLSRRRPDQGPALFDGRAFSLVTRQDAIDYLAWRQSDARRNSLSMLAQSVFSPSQLHGLSSDARRALLQENGYDPDALPAGFRNGRVVVPVQEPATTTFRHQRTGEVSTVHHHSRVLRVAVAPDFKGAGSVLIPERPTSST